MNNNPEIQEELKRIRKQGKAQIIIMVSSLVLVFLWFTCLSWLFGVDTFGQEAFEYFGMLGSFSLSFIIILAFAITVYFTLFYIYILKRFLPYLSDDEELEG